jgi:hypothetical protein
MNIEHLFPGTDLQVYKVTDVLSDDQMKLLIKLAEGKVPTGYRAGEIRDAIQDIRSASVEACTTIFNTDGLTATEENKDWPWFDLNVGEERDFNASGTYADDAKAYLAEFVVQPSTGGGEIFFKRRLLPENAERVAIKLAPGEMLVASRSAHHEFEIKQITSGVRFTLMTHIFG